MKILCVPCLLLLLASTVRSQVTVDVSAEIQPGVPPYQFKLDNRSGAFLMYRDHAPASVPSVRALSEGGQTTLIYPLRDLPGAQRLAIWDIASTNDGGVTFTTIVEYGAKSDKRQPLKSLIMTYDSRGNLQQIWDVYPYHHHKIAVDSTGSVFGFGTKNSPGQKDYPLVIRYSQTGKVLGEYLNASLFAGGNGVVDSGAPTGENALFIDDGEVVLWLSSPRELLRLSADGRVLKRQSFGAALDKLKDQNNADRVRIVGIGALPGKRVLMQLQFFPVSSDNSQMRVATAEMDSSGQDTKLTAPPVVYTEAHRLLGTGPDRIPLFMEGTSKRGVAILRKHEGN